MKTCPKCGECKPLSGFNKSKSNKNGIKSQCKICCAQAIKRWHEKNREYNKQWCKANFDKARESRRQWREANSEKAREHQRKWRESNLDKARECRRQWREANPDKINALNAKRRAAKLQRTPSWLTKDQLNEIETFYTAALAFKLYTGQEYHVDHIVPLQGKNVSGLHVPWNLRVIPETDNLKKSNLFED